MTSLMLLLYQLAVLGLAAYQPGGSNYSTTSPYTQSASPSTGATCNSSAWYTGPSVSCQSFGAH